MTAPNTIVEVRSLLHVQTPIIPLMSYATLLEFKGHDLACVGVSFGKEANISDTVHSLRSKDPFPSKGRAWLLWKRAREHELRIWEAL